MAKQKCNVVLHPVRYYGFLQGYRVYVNGKKYPKEKGEWYTATEKNRAVRNALSDSRMAGTAACRRNLKIRFKRGTGPEYQRATIRRRKRR